MYDKTNENQKERILRWRQPVCIRIYPSQHPSLMFPPPLITLNHEAALVVSSKPNPETPVSNTKVRCAVPLPKKKAIALRP